MPLLALCVIGIATQGVTLSQVCFKMYLQLAERVLLNLIAKSPVGIFPAALKSD